ncbi:S24/S26 family peptidase [Geomonas edaphica]|uniref:hypothetical protein n=1 Tax=Geomonas edaphica TaxID=2570226 RepID=UPI0010A8FDFA|nr:hypothetical protein [Geomonas edaphica]
MKRNLFAVLALSAMAAAAVPATAVASTTAGTTILNVVTVDYKDVSSAHTFNAASSTTVTVNLVKAGLNVTTAPSSATMPGFSCLVTGNYASNETFSAYYALTATANGQDTYQLSFTSTANDASSSSATYTVLKADGSPQGAASSLMLNSAIVVGISGSDTLLFPGGSLKSEADGGFTPGDIVVVDYSSSKTAYLVDTVTLGHAASTTVLEARDAVKLKMFPNASGIGIGNGNTAPAFGTTQPVIGSVMGEAAIVRIDVTAVPSAKDTDATVDYQLTATDSSNTYTTYIGSSSNSPKNYCRAGYFLATKLQILKQVKNLTKNQAEYTATASSDPRDVLEYLITVTNGGGQAISTAVSDNVPTYTKLVTFQDNYGSGTANDTTGFFAQVSDSSKTVDVKMDTAGDSQPASPNPSVGFGSATGVSAGSALHFYLGQGSSENAGGTVPSCNDSGKNTQALCVTPYKWNSTYTIKYRVQVD